MAGRKQKTGFSSRKAVHVGEEPYEKILYKNNLSERIESWSVNMGGVPVKIAPKVCAKYTKEQVDIWNHIMNHCRPKKEVSVIKKNILVNSLKQSTRNTTAVNIPLDGVKSCKDLDRSRLYHDLNSQLEDKNKNFETLKSSVEKNVKKIAALDNENEVTRMQIKSHKTKTVVMKMKLKTFEEKMVNHRKNLETATSVKEIFSERADEEKNNNNNKVDIEKMLEEINVVYHAHDLCDGKADLTMENEALLEKITEYLIVTPHVLLSAVTEILNKNNEELDQFIKTYKISSKPTSLPGNSMDKIRAMNIKLFLETNSLKKRIDNLKLTIEKSKNDVQFSVQNNMSNLGSTDSELCSTLMLNLINKCDELMAEKRKEYLKMKLDELKSAQDSIEIHKSIRCEQIKKLPYLNEKIEETSNLITKYSRVILKDKHLQIDDFAKKFVSEFTDKLKNMNSFVTENTVNCDDVSRGIDDNVFKIMKGFFKKETELFMAIPTEKILGYDKPPFSSGIIRQNSCLPYKSLVTQAWIKVLNNLRDEELKALQTTADSNDVSETVKKVKALEDQNKQSLVDKQSSIQSVIDSAQGFYEIAIDYLSLMDNDEPSH